MRSRPGLSRIRLKAMGICLFCGESRKLTGEHVVSEWIQKYVPRQHLRTDHTLQRTQALNASQVPFERSTRVRAGDPLSAKFKIVCGDCNSGWMSRIVEQAKPHIRPLLLGEWPQLHSAARQRIAAWATLCTMTWERADPEMAAILTEDHQHIMTTGQAPRNWRVWIGVSEADLATTYHHRGITIQPVDHEGVLPPVAQCTVIAVGRLLIHTASHPKPTALRNVRHSKPPAIVSIWPNPTGRLKMPSVPAEQFDVDRLQEETASFIHNFLQKAVESPT